MINIDEDALQCDFAETYHIYEMRELPLSKAALFAIGLRGNSRIKMKMQNLQYPIETILQANIVDRLSLLVWAKTENGRKGRNRPISIAQKLLGLGETKKVVAFTSANDFEKAKQAILKGGK